MTHRVEVIDSHTAGEPTRVVLSGGPALGDGSMAERLTAFRDRHDWFRSAVANEPRGSDVMVGALYCEPVDPSCAAGVIFFNNTGYLGMCGHGMMGLVTTLAHIGRIGAGDHRIETPVGEIAATLHEDGEVTITNVPSYRETKAVRLEVPGIGAVSGDIAWGGNRFLVVNEHGLRVAIDNVEALTDFSRKLRRAVGRADLQHIQLCGPPDAPGANGKNFVLCPGMAYDRSPCGTGTSAKIACLAADGQLGEGEIWRQESITGTVFEGSYRRGAGETIVPMIRGAAYITAEAQLVLDPRDPFQMGMRFQAGRGE